MKTIAIDVRQAELRDVEAVATILTEAAQWLERQGMGMWRADELTPERVAEDVAAGLFYVAHIGAHIGEPVGPIKFQLSDDEFWPDLLDADSAFVHRLAIRRSFAGAGVSTALLTWAATRASALGKRFLRLDCEASRPKLRAVYERFGFKHHSNRQVGPYFVARYELNVRRFDAG